MLSKSFLAIIIFLSVTLVQAISLGGNFQAYPPNVSEGKNGACKAKYMSQIEDCKQVDFDNGCSLKCQASLLVLQEELEVACVGVQAKASSLLALAFQHKLVKAVCNIDPETTLVHSTPTPTPSSSTPPAKSTKSVSTTTPVPQSSASSEQGQETSSDSVAATTTLTATSTTASQTSTKTSPPQPTKIRLTKQQLQLNQIKHSGGGSPMDMVWMDKPKKKTFTGGASQLSTSALLLLPVIAGLAVVIG
jgi:hypothetical protein